MLLLQRSGHKWSQWQSPVNFSWCPGLALSLNMYEYVTIRTDTCSCDSHVSVCEIWQCKDDLHLFLGHLSHLYLASLPELICHVNCQWHNRKEEATKKEKTYYLPSTKTTITTTTPTTTFELSVKNILQDQPHLGHGQ